MYEILTYCSENYFDGFCWSVRSWLRTQAIKIIVYTDFEMEPATPRIVVRRLYTKTKHDWVDNVGRKLSACNHYVQGRSASKNFVFMDVDCFVVSDFIDVFDPYDRWDLAVTRMSTIGSPGTVSSGLWFGRSGDRMLAFMDDWMALARRYSRDPDKRRRHMVSFVQYSFSDIAKQNFYAKSPKYRIKSLPCDVYNCEDSDMDEWRRKIRTAHPKVLHFKKRRFRDRRIVGEMLKLAGAI